MPETSKSGVKEVKQQGEALASALEAAIEKKTAKIGVIGLGYVGLPLIRTFVAAGFQNIGFDVDKKKVDSLAADGAT